MGKCPHCNALITYVNIVEMIPSAFMGTQLRTIAYVCPMCQKIINAQIDPMAIKVDTVNELKS